jgi:hypothetical protein
VRAFIFQKLFVTNDHGDMPHTLLTCQLNYPQQTPQSFVCVSLVSMPIAYILLAQQFLFVHHPCCLPSTTAATLILHANSWVRCLGELLLRLLLSARRVAALCRMAAGAFLRAPVNSSAHIIQHPTQSTQSGQSSKLQAEAQGRVR